MRQKAFSRSAAPDDRDDLTLTHRHIQITDHRKFPLLCAALLILRERYRQMLDAQ